MTGDAIADAAVAMIGTRFRLHGRHRERGVDCLGLVGCVLREAGLKPSLPRSYSLRQRDGVSEFYRFAEASGLTEVSGPPHAGDIVLYAVQSAQHHLAIYLSSDVIVHAHAGLRRVVAGPADPSWRTLKVWRAPLK